MMIMSSQIMKAHHKWPLLKLGLNCRFSWLILPNVKFHAHSSMREKYWRQILAHRHTYSTETSAVTDVRQIVTDIDEVENDQIKLREENNHSNLTSETDSVVSSSSSSSSSSSASGRFVEMLAQKEMHDCENNNHGKAPVKKDAPWVHTVEQALICDANSFEELKKVLKAHPIMPSHNDASSFLSRLVAVSPTPEQKALAKEWLISVNYGETFAKSLRTAGPLNSIVSAYTALLALDIDDDTRRRLFEMFKHKMKMAKEEESWPFVRMAVFHKQNGIEIPPEVADALAAIIDEKISDMKKCTEIIALINHGPFSNKGDYKERSMWLSAVEAKAQHLVGGMSSGESIALISTMNTAKRRDKELLRGAITQIVQSVTPLTMNQLATLVTAMGGLSLFDHRALKRIVSDLALRLCEEQKWPSIVTLSAGLGHLRFSEQKTWDLLLDWMVKNISKARPGELIQLLWPLSNCNVKSKGVQTVASQAASLLTAKKFSNPIGWLNCIHSLAVLGCLTNDLAETVLTGDFLNAVLVPSAKDAQGRFDRGQVNIRLKLMQVNAAARYDLVDYKGKLLNMEDNRLAITREFQEAVKQWKYSFSGQKLALMVDQCVQRYAPRECSIPPHLTPLGVYVETVLSPGLANQRAVAIKDWTDEMPKVALVYFQFPHMTSVVEDAPKLIGPLALGVRHLAAAGFCIAQIYQSNLAGKSPSEETEFIRRSLISAATANDDR